MSIDFSRILNSHKNKLFETTRMSKFPLSLFDISEAERVFTIKVRNSELKFSIVQKQDDFNFFTCIFSKLQPGFPTENFGIPANIDVICEKYKKWLSDVVAKYLELVSIPDQWTELSIIQPAISSKAFTQEDFDMFTENERRQIQDSLNEFQKLIKDEIAPMKEKLDFIQEKLDYLSDAVSKLNRFDWKGVALSTVIGIATNLSVDTSSGKQVFDLFQQAFGTAMRLLPK